MREKGSEYGLIICLLITVNQTGSDVVGGWSQWEAHGACTKTCMGGKQEKIRYLPSLIPFSYKFPA